MQEEENEKLGSRENNQVVRKLIKLTHTGLSTKVSMEVEKNQQVLETENQKGKRNLRMEKEIKGKKQKKRSINENRNPEIH